MDDATPNSSDCSPRRVDVARECVATIRELHRQLQTIESKLQCDYVAAVQDARGHFETTVGDFLENLDQYQRKSSLRASIDSTTEESQESTAVNQSILAPELQALPSRILASNQIESIVTEPIHDDIPGPERSISFTALPSDDEVINKTLIPREEVVVHEFLSGGTFGAVYRGTYDRKPVAVKVMSDPSAFIKEVKLAVTMSHPNIVQFIGVVLHSSKVFCSVMELMDGGDLRGLMDKYQEIDHPAGFDFTKIKIAFHVARALTYLHSRDAPVIHRDLKSKNILLNQALDAKLTDFGVSRERVVGPMTADVGSSLWMAPEVMVGQPYDEKADMFSFGVVLSELSTHLKPYAHAKVRPGANPQLVVLRRVAMGELSVKFSEDGPQTIARLGLACVSMNIKKRPTAVEAMHALHSALIQEARGQLNESCREHSAKSRPFGLHQGNTAVD